MSRRHAALKPQLNRIRAWAYEGSTDAWIAHQLETTAEAMRAFRQEHGIERGGPAPLAPITPDSVVEAMLAEEAAALEAGPEPIEPESVTRSEDEGESAPARAPAGAPGGPRPTTPWKARRSRHRPKAGEEASEPGSGRSLPSAARSRGTRGGAGREAAGTAAEARRAPRPEATRSRRRTRRAGAAARRGAGPRPAQARAEPRPRSRRSRGLEAACCPAASCCSIPPSTATRCSRSTGRRRRAARGGEHRRDRAPPHRSGPGARALSGLAGPRPRRRA